MKNSKLLVLLIAILCAVVLLAGCGNKNGDVSDDGTGTGEQTENNDNSNNDNQSSSSGNLDKNSLKVYPGSESTAEVPMGTCIDGKQTELCSVKLPGEYAVSATYTDENGNQTRMAEMDHTFLSNAITNTSYKNSTVLPSTIVVGSPGEINNDCTFMLMHSDMGTLDQMKEAVPGGKDINANSDHPAYIGAMEGAYDLAFAYKFNDDWMLVIYNIGDLADSMSLNEIGEAFYDLVTPLG